MNKTVFRVMDSSLVTSLPISLIIGSNNRSRDVFLVFVTPVELALNLSKGSGGDFLTLIALGYTPPRFVCFFTQKSNICAKFEVFVVKPL